jgi:hypothetical protein
MTESDFVERLIRALSQPTAPAGAPAMVASYAPRKPVLPSVASRPQPVPPPR